MGQVLLQRVTEGGGGAAALWWSKQPSGTPQACALLLQMYLDGMNAQRCAFLRGRGGGLQVVIDGRRGSYEWS